MITKKRLSNESKMKNVNSIVIAVILTSNFISIMLASIKIKDEGLLPIIFVSGLLITYITAFIFRTDVSTSGKSNIILVYFILFFFLLTFIFRGLNSFASVYFKDFMAFGMILLFLSLIPFSSRSIIRFTMYIGNFLLLNPLDLANYISLNTTIDRVGMGASYAMLPSVIATIIFFFFLRKEKKSKVNIISYISNGYLLLLILTEGTRGAVLSIVVLSFFIAYLKINQNIKKEIKYLYPTIYIAVGALLFWITFNIERIILSYSLLLTKLGFKSATLIKTSNLIEDEGIIGVFNSRDTVYLNAIDLFKESPIWGHGIGSYADFYHGTYPHNMFLQLMVEGGLILTIPFLFIILFGVWTLIKPWSVDRYHSDIKYLILLLGTISIPRLMLSSYLWQNQSFWLLVFVILSISSRKKISREVSIHSTI